jgi:cell division septal protein FtsQ
MLPSVLLTAAILLLPALLYAWGRHADSFAVERVTLAGGHRVSEKQALRTLRREFLGDNLFTITTGDVRAALDDYCYLAAVEVDRDFPTDLRVRLVEYRPSMYVFAKGRWFVVADTGHVICEVGEAKATPSRSASAGVPAATPSPTPSPTSSATPSVTPSGSPSSSASAVTPAGGGEDAAAATAQAAAAQAAAAQAAAAQAAAARAAALAGGPTAMKPVLPRMASAVLPVPGRAVADEKISTGLRVLAGLPASLRKKVKVVSVDKAGQVSLYLTNGPFVEFGAGERLVAKVLSLRAVLAAYQRAGNAPTFIDVSSPDRPLGRPRLSS